MPIVINEKIGKILDELKDIAKTRMDLWKEFTQEFYRPSLRFQSEQEMREYFIKQWDELCNKENELWQQYDILVSQQKDC